MNAPIKIPTELEAEKAVLGGIFMEQDTLVYVIDMLSPGDFYDSKHKIIYKAMIDLSQSNKTVDPTTVLSYLDSSNQLEQAGGAIYITSLAEHVYSVDNIETYAELILDASFRRNAIEKFSVLSQEGYNTNITAEDYLETVEKAIFDLQQNKRTTSFRKMNEVARKVLDETTKNATKNSEIIGLDTGFVGLNKITQGFQDGALIILAARPAMGKSAFALNLAYNVASLNKGGQARVAVFNLEMSDEQLVERMISAKSQIKLKNIKSGRILQPEWIRFNTAVNELSNLNIYFDDASDTSIQSIRSKCRKLKMDEGLDLIIIDYLQLIAGENNAKVTEYDKITKISRSLKLLARELEVPVIALSQLSRDVEKREDKHPGMADLRSSGSIEQDADIVMFLYRDDYYNKAAAIDEFTSKSEFIFAKNRNGGTPTIDLIFKRDTSTFANYNKMENEE
jgi:replicative DNA helicase